MRSDVHGAALKAAAKMAFSVVLLNGCATPAEADESEEATSAGSAATEAPCPTKVADAGSATTTDAAPAKPACDAILASAYPTPGQYRWEAERQPVDVVTCCREELLNEGGPFSQYRWDCCVAHNPAAPELDRTETTSIAMACTPWGPPVPPAMTRALRAGPDVDAWLAGARA